MKQRAIMIIVIVAVVLGGGFYAFNQLVPSTGEQDQGPVYSTQEVVRGDITVGVETTGQLNPSRGGSLRAPGTMGPSAGSSEYVIKEILVEEGDAVTKGQVLVLLEAPDLESEIKSLEDKLENDREFLAELTGVPVHRLHEINPARGVTLRAPIDGRVTGLEVTEGSELKQGQTVARIVDDSRFKVVANLYPSEYRQVREGQKMVLKFPYFNGLYEAVVTEVNPNPIPAGEGEEFGKYFVYRVTLEAKNPGLVQPGMKVDVGLPAQDGAGTEATFFVNAAEVEGFVNEERVLNRVEAVVTEVHVHNMDLIKKGEPIISLTGTDVQEMIEEELDELRENESKLRELKSRFEQLEVKASMDGIVARINREEGETVGPGEWIGHIYNTSDMRMWAKVDDIDVLLVKQGAPVEVTVDALPGETFKGEVTHVDTMGEDEKGIPRFRVEIRVEGGPQLRPGMQAHAYIDAGSAEDVLLVPLEAIFEEDGKPCVEILNPDGTTKVVPVKLGLMNDRVAEVKSGVKEGDLVITGSSADLLPSQHIGSQDTILPDKGDGKDGQEGSAGKER